MCTKSSSIHGKDIVNPHAAWIVTGMPKNKTKVSNSCPSHVFSFKNWTSMGEWSKRHSSCSTIPRLMRISLDGQEIYIKDLRDLGDQEAVNEGAEIGNTEQSGRTWEPRKMWECLKERQMLETKSQQVPWRERFHLKWQEYELFNSEKDMKWNGLLQRSEAVQKMAWAPG